MGDRADLLELIDRAPGPLRTLRATWDTWSDRARVFAAMEAGRSNAVTVSSPPDAARAPLGEWRTTQQIWVEVPDRWRVLGGHLDVCDGTRRWIGSPELMTVYALGHVQPLDPFGITLRPGTLLGALTFGAPTAVEHHGRPAWRVEAGARHGSQDFDPRVMLVPRGHYEVVVDAATGIVLRHESWMDGEVCARTVLRDVTVNEPIDPATFSIGDDDTARVQTEADSLFEVLVRTGVDTDGVDPTDSDALRERLHESRGFGARSRSLEHRKSHHVPTGPLPADPDAALASIRDAVEHLDRVEAGGDSLVNVQAGTGLAPLLRQARERVPGLTDDQQLLLDDAKLLSPDRAVIWFSLGRGADASPFVQQQEGYAVLVDGRWVLEHATAASLLSQAGIQVPPVEED